MEILMRILVIIFEILYYSLFMKFSRKEGEFWKYILLFAFVSIVLFFTSSFNIYSYIIFMAITIVGLKKISKTSLYDMFVIFAMLLIKLLIEMIFAFTLPLIISNINVCKILLGIVKVLILILVKNKMNFIYLKLKKLWDNNNFYIRYLFTVFMFLYVISACVFIINYS